MSIDVQTDPSHSIHEILNLWVEQGHRPLVQQFHAFAAEDHTHAVLALLKSMNRMMSYGPVDLRIAELTEEVSRLARSGKSLALLTHVSETKVSSKKKYSSPSVGVGDLESLFSRLITLSKGQVIAHTKQSKASKAGPLQSSQSIKSNELGVSGLTTADVNVTQSVHQPTPTAVAVPSLIFEQNQSIDEWRLPAPFIIGGIIMLQVLTLFFSFYW